VIGLKKIKRKNKMNRRTIIASLNKIANELDNNCLYKEANEITNVMNKIAQLPGGGIAKNLANLDLSGVGGPVYDAAKRALPGAFPGGGIAKLGLQGLEKLQPPKNVYTPSVAVPGLSKYIGQSLADIATFEMRINVAKRGKPLMENQNQGSIDLVSKSLDVSINALNQLARTFDAKMNTQKGIDPFGLALVGNKMPNSAWSGKVGSTNSMSELAGQFASFVQLQRRVYSKAAEVYPDVASYLSSLSQTLSDFRLYTPSTERNDK